MVKLLHDKTFTLGWRKCEDDVLRDRIHWKTDWMSDNAASSEPNSTVQLVLAMG